MKNVITAALLAGLVAGTTASLNAAEGAAEKPASPASPASPAAPAATPQKPRAIPFQGKVTAVDKTAKTVTLQGRDKERTVQVTSETKIIKDGKPAVLDAVAVGEIATGRAKPGPAGKLEALILNVGAKPDAPKASKKKEDAK